MILEKVGTLGNEFGTVTGRKEMRLVRFMLLKQSVIISGLKGLALTKLDVLDSFDKIMVCTAEYKDKTYNYLPMDLDDLSKLSLEYIELDGWKEKQKIKNFSELPTNAKKYISFIEEFVGIPVTMLSTSPERRIQFYFKTLFNANFFVSKYLI